MSSVSLINPKNLGVVDEEIAYESVDELAAIISSESWAPGLFSEARLPARARGFRRARP